MSGAGLVAIPHWAELVTGPATSGNSAFTRITARLPVGFMLGYLALI
jgi:hypothetical protein